MDNKDNNLGIKTCIRCKVMENLDCFARKETESNVQRKS